MREIPHYVAFYRFITSFVYNVICFDGKQILVPLFNLSIGPMFLDSYMEMRYLILIC